MKKYTKYTGALVLIGCLFQGDFESRAEDTTESFLRRGIKDYLNFDDPAEDLVGILTEQVEQTKSFGLLDRPINIARLLSEEDNQALAANFNQTVQESVLEKFSNNAFLTAGYTSLSAYNLQPGTFGGNPGFYVSDEDTASSFYIDYNVNMVWAWDNARMLAPGGTQHSLNGTPVPDYRGLKWSLTNYDFKGRIAYFFEEQQENISPSALVGAENFGIETYFGMNVLAGWVGPDRKAPTGKLTIGPFVSSSFVTEENFGEVQQKHLAGLAFTSGLSFGKGDGRKILFQARTGVAFIDTINGQSTAFLPANQALDSTGTPLTSPTYYVDGDGLSPKTAMEAGIGAELEAMFPVAKNSYLRLQTRIYDTNTKPDNWIVSAGFMFPLSSEIVSLKDL